MQTRGALKLKQNSQGGERKRRLERHRSKSRPRRRSKQAEEPGQKLYYTLYTKQEVPAWSVDNDFIVSAYREADRDWCFYARSIFAVHNETVNIWSHLLGFLLFLCFAGDHFFVKGASLYSIGDNIVFAAFYIGAMAMFLLSTLLHTFGVIGEAYLPFLARFDYIGISLMITGSFFPVLFFIYYCEPIIYCTHLAIISMLGLGTLYFIFAPGFERPEMRARRTIMYVLFGLYAVFPLGQFVGRPASLHHFSTAGVWVIESASLYLGGAAIFVNALPERFSPRTFDLLFSSHQIWHCCVLAAAVLHWYGCWAAYEASQQGGWRQCGAAVAG